MQLKNKNKKAISIALAAATSSLLANAAVGEENDVGWEIDTSVLYYGEQDDRVEDTSLALRIARRFEDGRAFVAGLSTDSLTGASPTGAVPLNEPQTFTRPSARGQYVTQPGEIPLDDSFKDSRVAGYVSWTQPFGENWTANVGASFSTEYDYEHLGFNASLARDFNNKNTTVAAGFAYAQDELDPEGGAPMPLSEMRGVRDTSNKLSGTQDKSVTDLLIGVTQILNERMLLQVNYSFSQSDDYHNDPFKFLTVLASSGAPVVGPDGLYSYRFESRPDERTKHSLFTKLKTYIGGGALDTSYRFMTDDWGINSHTLDMRYRFNISERNYIEPHLRFYQQSEADFYQANLIAGDTVPNEASADYRLAEFTGTTFGVKVGHKFNNGNEASARLEWYNQDGTAKLAGVPGGANVFPELDAVIFQVSYRFHLQQQRRILTADFNTVNAAPEPLAFGSRQTTITPKNGYYLGEFLAMGCPCQVLMETDDVQFAEHLLAKVRDEAWRIEARWSRYLSTSLVQKINHAPAEMHALDAESASLIDYCYQLWRLSDGAFDITSGVLRQVWNFDGGDSVPAQAAVEDMLQYVGWHKVSWQSPNLQMLPSMQIDLGGVGKEYAVDLCAKRLHEHSDISCLVNFGGDCAVSRARKLAPGWDVGIESTASVGQVRSRVLLQEGALATSGNSHRFVWHNGKRLSHILDARTGWPVSNAPRSVTVQANTCLEAGMFATLACLNGGTAREFLDQSDVTHWLQA